MQQTECLHCPLLRLLRRMRQMQTFELMRTDYQQLRPRHRVTTLENQPQKHESRTCQYSKQRLSSSLATLTARSNRIVQVGA